MFGRKEQEKPVTLGTLLRDVESDLQNVGEIIRLVQTPGWEKLREVMDARVKALQTSINNLARNPAQKIDELRDTAALHAALSGFLETIDVTVAAKETVMENATAYREQYEQAQRQKDRFR